MMRGISICAGIGGGDLAAEMTQGIEIVGQVERDPFCRSVLEHHWPSVPKISTIQEFTGHEFGPVDICIAGIPCQPFSSAGLRRGEHDERNLWPNMWRILAAQCERGEPYRWFILENVKGLFYHPYFKAIIRDLASLGYRIGWAVYGACEVGAPHRRERVFVVAHYPGIRGSARRTEPEGQQGQANAYSYGAPAAGADVADTSGDRRHWGQNKQEPIARREHQADAWKDGPGGIVAHSCSKGLQGTRSTRLTTSDQKAAAGMEPEPERCSNVAHASGEGLPQRDIPATSEPSQPTTQRQGEGGAQSAMGGGASRFPDGLAGYTHQWPSGPGQAQEEWEPARVVTHRMPRRVAQIKALGNAIVPQQLAVLLREIVKVEEETRC